MSETLGPLSLFGLACALLLIIAVRKGFFTRPSQEWEVPVRIAHLMGAFAIYFVISSLGSLLAISLFRNQIQLHYVGYASWLNFTLSFLVAIALTLYLMYLPANVGKALLFRPGKHRISEECASAFYTWIISFPLVLFLSQFLEQLLFHLFHITHVPDQIAVKFLKATFANPLYFVLAVVSIVVLAPFIEEILFRGFLQTFIRKHLGTTQAIVITSVCFALFHYAAGQGFANISIICSLFVLSLFLGFLYEKQGSLRAAMLLHSGFNIVSVVNLYLFGGFTAGL